MIDLSQMTGEEITAFLVTTRNQIAELESGINAGEEALRPVEKELDLLALGADLLGMYVPKNKRDDRIARREITDLRDSFHDLAEIWGDVKNELLRSQGELSKAKRAVWACETELSTRDFVSRRKVLVDQHRRRVSQDARATVRRVLSGSNGQPSSRRRRVNPLQRQRSEQDLARRKAARR